MPDVGTEYPVSCRLDLGETIDVGMTPIGHRLIGPITGGTVEGPALQGAVRADGGTGSSSAATGRWSLMCGRRCGRGMGR